MIRNRTETIEFGDFMTGEYKKSKSKKALSNKDTLVNIAKWGATIPVVGHLATKTIPAFAQGSNNAAMTVSAAVPAMATGEVMEKIAHAFDPLIELMVGISLPIAGVMLTGGALMIMIGQREMGYKLIMNCSLGYVLVQMSPLFIDLLAGVGSAI